MGFKPTTSRRVKQLLPCRRGGGGKSIVQLFWNVQTSLALTSGIQTHHDNGQRLVLHQLSHHHYPKILQMHFLPQLEMEDPLEDLTRVLQPEGSKHLNYAEVQSPASGNHKLFGHEVLRIECL